VYAMASLLTGRILPRLSRPQWCWVI